jgi:hypothetical protein
MNNFLKSTQESIKEAQRQAAEQSAAATSGGSGGASATGGPPEKVPTLGELFMNSLSSQRDAVTKKTASVDIRLPEVDIKLPEINGIQVPEFKTPSAGLSLSTDVTLPEAGKALPLGDYIKAKAVGALPQDPSTVQSTVADAQVKFGVMVANFYKLIGKDAPESIKIPDMQDLADISNRVSTFDVQEFMDSLPDSAPWTAVAAGALLVILGARKDTDATASTSRDSASQTVAAASQALGGLTDDLVCEQKRGDISGEFF